MPLSEEKRRAYAQLGLQLGPAESAPGALTPGTTAPAGSVAALLAAPPPVATEPLSFSQYPGEIAKGIISGYTGELADVGMRALGSSYLNPAEGSWWPYHLGYLGGAVAGLPQWLGTRAIGLVGSRLLPTAAPLTKAVVSGALGNAPLGAFSAAGQGQDPIEGALSAGVLGGAFGGIGQAIAPGINRYFRHTVIPEFPTPGAAAAATPPPMAVYGPPLPAGYDPVMETWRRGILNPEPDPMAAARTLGTAWGPAASPADEALAALATANRGLDPAEAEALRAMWAPSPELGPPPEPALPPSVTSDPVQQFVQEGIAKAFPEGSPARALAEKQAAAKLAEAEKKRVKNTVETLVKHATGEAELRAPLPATQAKNVPAPSMAAADEISAILEPRLPPPPESDAGRIATIGKEARQSRRPLPEGKVQVLREITESTTATPKEKADASAILQEKQAVPGTAPAPVIPLGQVVQRGAQTAEGPQPLPDVLPVEREVPVSNLEAQPAPSVGGPLPSAAEEVVPLAAPEPTAPITAASTTVPTTPEVPIAPTPAATLPADVLAYAKEIDTPPIREITLEERKAAKQEWNALKPDLRYIRTQLGLDSKQMPTAEDFQRFMTRQVKPGMDPNVTERRMERILAFAKNPWKMLALNEQLRPEAEQVLSAFKTAQETFDVGAAQRQVAKEVVEKLVPPTPLGRGQAVGTGAPTPEDILRLVRDMRKKAGVGQMGGEGGLEGGGEIGATILGIEGKQLENLVTPEQARQITNQVYDAPSEQALEANVRLILEGKEPTVTKRRRGPGTLSALIAAPVAIREAYKAIAQPDEEAI